MLLSLVLVSLLALRVTGQTTGLPPVSTPVTTAGCNTTKQCFFNPIGPTCLGFSCNAIATWTASSTPGYVDFELWTAFQPNTGWVALGFSYDKLMGNDSVMQCVVNLNSNDALSINVSYNKIAGPANIPLSYAPKPTTVINEMATYNEGLSCRFSRSIAADGPEVFTLNASYYLLLAYGPVTSTGAIAQHSMSPLAPVVSSSPVNIAASAQVISSPTTAASVSPAGGGGKNPASRPVLSSPLGFSVFSLAFALVAVSLI